MSDVCERSRSRRAARTGYATSGASTSNEPSARNRASSATSGSSISDAMKGAAPFKLFALEPSADCATIAALVFGGSADSVARARSAAAGSALPRSSRSAVASTATSGVRDSVSFVTSATSGVPPSLRSAHASNSFCGEGRSSHASIALMRSASSMPRPTAAATAVSRSPSAGSEPTRFVSILPETSSSARPSTLSTRSDQSSLCRNF